MNTRTLVLGVALALELRDRRRRRVCCESVSSPSVSSTTALMRSVAVCGAHGVERLRSSRRRTRCRRRRSGRATRARSSRRSCDSGADGTSGWIWSEKIVSPTRSCGSTLREERRRARPWRCSRRCSSFIEPEVSSTSRTLAGLRSARQAFLIAASTRGSGSAEHARRAASGRRRWRPSIGATGCLREVGGAEAVLAPRPRA